MMKNAKSNKRNLFTLAPAHDSSKSQKFQESKERSFQVLFMLATSKKKNHNINFQLSFTLNDEISRELSKISEHPIFASHFRHHFLWSIVWERGSLTFETNHSTEQTKTSQMMSLKWKMKAATEAKENWIWNVHRGFEHGNISQFA